MANVCVALWFYFGSRAGDVEVAVQQLPVKSVRDIQIG